MIEAAIYPPPIEGEGLVLRPWDADLARQMAGWGERGFPYHAFDLGYLADRRRADATVRAMREASQHRHFVACEGGIPVGRVSVNLSDPAGLYLWNVHVPPEHGGRGVCRRMLAVLLRWLERDYPGLDFILISNTFATNAHRAYAALGFSIVETRWQFDREVALGLWKGPLANRSAIATHIRFSNGRWECRAHVFRRRPGAAMDTARRRAHEPAAL